MSVRKSTNNDTLRLELRDGDVCVFVNDHELIDLLRKFEIQYDASLAGQYDYVRPSDFLEDAYVSESGDDRLLVGCNCGEVGCWPIVAQVERSEDVVTWYEFQQPHRKKWDYSNFGPFSFSATQYDYELSKIKNNHE